MEEPLVDRFYEAALVPELWRATLADFAAEFEARESGLVLVEPGGDMRWAATEHCAAQLNDYVERFPSDGLLARNLRTERFEALTHRGFMREVDLLTDQEIDSDGVQARLRAEGLEWQAFTRIQLPGGYLAGFSIERIAKAGPFNDRDLARLDTLWPHLGRASMTAVQLGLERARNAAATMEAIGLAAAVLSARGTVRASNPLFDELTGVLRPAAFGMPRLADAQAQRMFVEAIENVWRADQPPVRSIPVRGDEDSGPMVLHLLPLRRAARDVFTGGEIMLVVTRVGGIGAAPESAVLRALFDLTAAEVRIAMALAAGRTISEAAKNVGVTTKSARTYLDRIFRKTGTRRQIELVSLLRSAQPFTR